MSERIRIQFDYLVKKVIRNTIINYRIAQAKRELQEYLVENPEQYYHETNVFSDFPLSTFSIFGTSIAVNNEWLFDELSNLTEMQRNILLLYYFLGYSDMEIGRCLHVNRSTIFRNRKNVINLLRQKVGVNSDVSNEKMP